MKMNKLNGWQRLLVILSVIYLIFLSIIFLPEIIGSTNKDVLKIKKMWASETIMILSHITLPGDSNISLESLSTEQLLSIKKQILQKKELEETEDDKKVDQIINDNTEEILKDGKYTGTLNELQKNNQEKIDKTYHARNSFYFLLLIIWCTPIIILYILGWSIGWIYKGFKFGNN